MDTSSTFLILVGLAVALVIAAVIWVKRRRRQIGARSTGAVFDDLSNRFRAPEITDVVRDLARMSHDAVFVFSTGRSLAAGGLTFGVSEEAFRVIQGSFGEEWVCREVGDHYLVFAAGQGWTLPDPHAVTVSIVRDISHKQRQVSMTFRPAPSYGSAPATSAAATGPAAPTASTPAPPNTPAAGSTAAFAGDDGPTDDFAMERTMEYTVSMSFDDDDTDSFEVDGCRGQLRNGEDVFEVVSTRAPITLGRGHDVDIRVDDPATSREHARLRHTDEGWVLEPLTTKNRTFVDRRAVTQPVPLLPAATVVLGGTAKLHWESACAHRVLRPTAS